MIGITHFAGACKVCEEMHFEDRKALEEMIMSRRSALLVADRFALSWRDVKQHGRQCLGSKSRDSETKRKEQHGTIR